MDAFDAAFGSGKASSAPPDDAFSAAFAAPSPDSESAKPGLLDLYTGGKEARVGLNKAAESSAAGIKQGVTNVLHFADPALSYLSSKSPSIDAIGSAVGLPTADQAHQQFISERNANDTAHADDANYETGKFVGSSAATLPVMGAVGRGLSAGSNALLDVINASPTLSRMAPYVERLGQIISGNAEGNVVERYGSRIISGAGQGAEVATLNNASSDEPFSEQIKQGAETGAIVGPAGTLLRDTGKYVGGAVRSALDLTTETGAQNTAGNVVRNFAGKPLNLDTREIVPGSIPTMAEASGNAGVASVQRTARDLNPQPFVEREQANSLARRNFLTSVAGTPTDIEAATQARADAALPKLEQAFSSAVDANPASVNRTISRILNSPAGQRDAVSNALNSVREKLVIDNPLTERASAALGPVREALSSGKLSDARASDFAEARRLLISASRGNTSEEDLVRGLSALAKKQKIEGPIDDALKTIKSGGARLQTDPEQLYGIRQSVTDMLSPLAAGTDRDARLAAKQLSAVTKSLDNAIEKAAPGYKDYLKTYSEMSRPIDQMKFLQGLNLTDAQGNIVLSKVQNALKNINKLQSATGNNPAKSLLPEQVQALERVRDDLLRASRVNLGRSLGSNTVQNAATQNALQSMLPGKVGQFASKANPETVGATVGGLIGLMSGGTVETAGGAIVGNMAGRGISSYLHGRNAVVQHKLEDILLNPSAMGPPALPGRLNRLIDASGVKELSPYVTPLAVLNRSASNAPASP